MFRDLTTAQMREIAHPSTEVLVHRKPWGIIVETRRCGRAINVESYDWTGAVRPDQKIFAYAA